MAVNTSGHRIGGWDRFLRLAAVVIVAGTIAFAAAGYFIVRNDLHALRRADGDNLVWAALQLEIEFQKFGKTISEFSHEETSITAQQVNDRFDILWSRISLFAQGSVGSRLVAYQDESQVVTKFFAVLRQYEDVMVNLKAGDAAAAAEVMQAFAPFEAEFRHLSQSILHGEEANRAQLRAALWSSSNILTYLSLAAVISSFLLLWLFGTETRRYKRIAEENIKLLATAEKANQVKSQFLGMMSHELRTPMNGVLGLLALAKQNSAATRQEHLLEQAERSGRQMISLLTDILDFSSLDEDNFHLDRKPFKISQLCRAVNDVFGPTARREGVHFVMECDADGPAMIRGDFRRIRQSLIHLAAYFVETAGTDDIRINVSFEPGFLKFRLTYQYGKAGSDWEPSLILGEIDRGDNNFASDALGPAIARGLIERMQGKISLDRIGDSRVAVVVSIPAEAVVIDQVVAKVVTKSAALAAISSSALTKFDVIISDGEVPEQIHVVLIEAGGEGEYETLQHHRQRYPKAMMVALGKAVSPEDFDDWIELPIDMRALENASFMSMAS